MKILPLSSSFSGFGFFRHKCFPSNILDAVIKRTIESKTSSIFIVGLLSNFKLIDKGSTPTFFKIINLSKMPNTDFFFAFTVFFGPVLRASTLSARLWGLTNDFSIHYSSCSVVWLDCLPRRQAMVSIG